MARMNPTLAKTFLGVQKNGKLSRCPDMPNCVCSQYPDDTAHFMEPLNFKGSVDDARAKLKNIIRNFKGFNLVEEKGDYLRVEVVSSLFRFVDDIEFLFNAEANRIHFRSASRLGTWDLGANRKRVLEIKKLFES